MKLMDKLKFLREAKDWTKKRAAKAVGVPYTTYVEYEDRKRQCHPTGWKVQSIANAFGVNVNYLFDETKGYPPGPDDLIDVPGTYLLRPFQDDPHRAEEGLGETGPYADKIISRSPTSSSATTEEAQLAFYKKINIIGFVSAGETEVAYDDAGLPVGGSIEEPLNRPYDVEDENAYGLLIEGDSMLPGYPKGTKVVVSPSERVKTGDIVICRLRSTGKVYIKEVKFQNDMVILSSHNAASYAPMAAPYKDILFCHKVVWVRRP